MGTICGIEEAGRGPVIGPMVMVGVVIDEDEQQKLVDMGVKDSKMLTPIQRERLFDRVIETVSSHKIVILSPEDIDNTLNSPNSNLNWLEGDTTALILNELLPDKAILDCPSNNIKAYEDHVRNQVPASVEVVAEHKADLNHVIVGAASILAKVTRDREIEKLKDDVGENFGSGYPSDPATKRFLELNWDKHPKIFRKSWASYKKIAKAKAQKGLGEF